jgi:hypothetical protein
MKRSDVTTNKLPKILSWGTSSSRTIAAGLGALQNSLEAGAQSLNHTVSLACVNELELSD